MVCDCIDDYLSVEKMVIENLFGNLDNETLHEFSDTYAGAYRVFYCNQICGRCGVMTDSEYKPELYDEVKEAYNVSR